MLRTALKPRWLGLFALLLVIMATCAQLGLWQLHVAQDKGLADALRKAHEARPALLDTVDPTARGLPEPPVQPRRHRDRDGMPRPTSSSSDRAASTGAPATGW